MDAHHFDTLARRLAHGGTRRRFLQGVAVGAAGGFAAVSTPRDAGAVCGAGYNSLSCSPGEDCCNEVCVNTRRSNLHCGACGRQCPAGSRCTSGGCYRSDGTLVQPAGGGGSDAQPGPGQYDSNEHGFSLGWDQTWAFLDGRFVDWSQLAWKYLPLPTAPDGAVLDDLFYLQEVPETLGQVMVYATYTSSSPFEVLQAEYSTTSLVSGNSNLAPLIGVTDGAELVGEAEGYAWAKYAFERQTSGIFDPQFVSRYTQIWALLPGQSVLVVQWTQAGADDFRIFDHVDALVANGLLVPVY